VSDGRGGAATSDVSPEPSITPPGPDAEISEALSRGETQQALSLCLHRHGPSIGRLCMAMLGSQVDADDVTQETLLSAHQAFGEQRGDGSVRAWLLGIARNKCLQHLEKKRRRGSKLGLVRNGQTSSTLDETLGLERRAARARVLLEQVKPSDRDALLLRFGADLSFEEVAAACGIDEPTARKRVSRALLRLRSALEEEHDDD
jgi:RNA polymerase sigma-70 factor (ECF subfamily)